MDSRFHIRKSIGRLAVFCMVSIAPLSLCQADVLLPGYKSVKHELIFEPSPEFEGHCLVAAPIAGFSGVLVIQPGERFRFSTKYGTRFYLVPNDVADFSEFDRERFQSWPSTRPPISEIKSVLVTSPVASALTTLRFAGANESGPIIERVSHVLLDRRGREASATRSILVFGLLISAGLAICLFAIRRMKKSSRSSARESMVTG